MVVCLQALRQKELPSYVYIIDAYALNIVWIDTKLVI